MCSLGGHVGLNRKIVRSNRVGLEQASGLGHCVLETLVQ